jgi:hypothetical protein
MLRSSARPRASRRSPAVSRVLSPPPLPRAGDGHSSTPTVTGRLQRPTWYLESARAAPAGEPAVPIWSCSRWGLPSPPCHHGGGALLPHHFTLARVATSGLFSVALSFESPRLVVDQHLALGARTFLGGRPLRAVRRDHPPARPNVPAFWGRCSAFRISTIRMFLHFMSNNTSCRALHRYSIRDIRRIRLLFTVGVVGSRLDSFSQKARIP